MPEDICGIFRRFISGKDRTHILRSTDPILHPWTTVTLHGSTKYKTFSPPLTFTAWMNVKYCHGRGTTCSGTNSGLFCSQNCNFPEESFIFISFCYSLESVRRRRTEELRNAISRLRGNSSPVIQNLWVRMRAKGQGSTLQAVKSGLHIPLHAH
jgi:hypothetical protein